MSDFVIRAEDLAKQYKITSVRYRPDTLKDQIVESVKSGFRIGRCSQGVDEIFWALRDVSFDIKQGEVIGIIGSNGAGKSTLLKILSRITEPTAGRVEIQGRIGSLLEVGTGFDRELSGRENLFLSGAILGMKRAEIKRKFDEIVAFAEVEQFIDTPVKRYSSGMYLRLAFSVAAHLEPEILLVDEVLAVGDASFQKKCLGKMGEVAGGGRTVLFVSHNMAAITSLCEKVMWLENGSLKTFASEEEVVAGYLSSVAEKTGEVVFPNDTQQAPGSEYVRLIAVRVRDRHGEATSILDSRFPFTVEVEYRILKPTRNLRIGLTFITYDGTVVISSKDSDGTEGVVERAPGIYISRCTIPGNFFNYGQYFISVGSDSPTTQSHFFLDRVLAFSVELLGGVGGLTHDGRRGLLRIDFPWHTQKSD